MSFDCSQHPHCVWDSVLTTVMLHSETMGGAKSHNMTISTQCCFRSFTVDAAKPELSALKTVPIFFFLLSGANSIKNAPWTQTYIWKLGWVIQVGPNVASSRNEEWVCLTNLKLITAIWRRLRWHPIPRGKRSEFPQLPQGFIQLVSDPRGGEATF